MYQFPFQFSIKRRPKKKKYIFSSSIDWRRILQIFAYFSQAYYKGDHRFCLIIKRKYTRLNKNGDYYSSLLSLGWEKYTFQIVLSTEKSIKLIPECIYHGTQFHLVPRRLPHRFKKYSLPQLRATALQSGAAHWEVSVNRITMKN